MSGLLVNERGLARAGFVLAGGRSSRMGRDKALLPLNGSTLIEQVASRVLLAAGTVTLIGSPDRYRSLGYPVRADLAEDCGPLGGVYTALSVTQADWNLIVACDMPGVTADFLENLLDAAAAAKADCLVPETAAGLAPLCAVYHRRCAAAAAAAISRKELKMHDLIATLQTVRWAVPDPAPLANVNTPEEWARR
jgi:molybdopterin-guanine dinucleotide biosynthesis protein A